MNETQFDQVVLMLRLQDEMNAHVDEDWRDHQREWWRAIWIECAELMDHYGGWKWWKHSECDRDQVLLEIVDIWHFGLSLRIERTASYAEAAQGITKEWGQATDANGFHDAVEKLALSALQQNDLNVAVIPSLLRDIDCDFGDLFANYVGKNVLNVFRQDHGYRDGTYQKIWNGREDNEHLVDVLAGIDMSSADPRTEIYSALKSNYPAN